MTDLVKELQKQNAFLREQLRAKDEQLRAKDEQHSEQLRVKDEQLRVKDEQLRTKDEQHSEQLRAKDEQHSEQLRAKDEQHSEQLRVKDEQINQQANYFHVERIRMIDTLDTIGGKVDNLLTSHKETSNIIINQLTHLESRITIHPSQRQKQQGFAVLLRLRNEQDPTTYDLQFVAGQSAYVHKRCAGLQPAQLLVPFTPIANGINLRNNFAKLANARLQETLGVSSSKRKLVESYSDVVDQHGLTAKKSFVAKRSRIF